MNCRGQCVYSTVAETGYDVAAGRAAREEGKTKELTLQAVCSVQCSMCNLQAPNDHAVCNRARTCSVSAPRIGWLDVGPEEMHEVLQLSGRLR